MPKKSLLNPKNWQKLLTQRDKEGKNLLNHAESTRSTAIPY